MVSRQLLWKDYRQALPGLAGCWAIVASLMTIAFFGQLLGNNTANFAGSILFVLVVPTLAALATCGLLIGQERETGAWNWSSSLPIAWQQAYLSKTLVWLISSVVMLATLLLLFGGLWMLCVALGVPPRPQNDWLTPYPVVLAVALVPIEVYVYFSLFSLLLNETLLAMTLAGVVVSFLHFVLTDSLPRVLLHSSPNATLSLEGPGALGIALSAAITILAGGALVLRAFRWRWSVGQHARVSLRTNHTESEIAMNPTLWANYALVTRQPSQWWMLLCQGATSLFGFRLIIFLASLVLMTVIFFRSRPQAVLAVLYVAAGLLGLSVFAADQPRGRYRFLADRGVDWRLLLVTRSAIPLAMLAVLAMIPFFVQNALPPLLQATFLHQLVAYVMIVPAAFLIFLLGMVCSLCTSSTIMGFTMMVITLALTTLAYSLCEFLWSILSLDPPIPLWRVLTGVIGLPWLLIWISRQWLIRATLPRARFMATMAVVLLAIPMILEVTTNFMFYPNAPWRGLPVNEVRTQSSVTPLPILELHEALPATRLLGEDWEEAVRYSWLLATQEERVNLNSFDTGKQADLLVQLKALEERIDGQLADGPRCVDPGHIQLMDATAYLGYSAANRMANAELAAAAWKVNTRLNSLVDLDTLDNYELLQSRARSETMRRLVSDERWIEMTQHARLEELFNQPAPVPKLERLVKMAATVCYNIEEGAAARQWEPRDMSNAMSYMGRANAWHLYSRPDWAWKVIDAVPPLRWNYRRQATYALDSQLFNLAQAPTLLELPYISPWSFASQSVAQLRFNDTYFEQYMVRLQAAISQR